jgi:hypothetical protein
VTESGAPGEVNVEGIPRPSVAGLVLIDGFCGIVEFIGGVGTGDWSPLMEDLAFLLALLPLLFLDFMVGSGVLFVGIAVGFFTAVGAFTGATFGVTVGLFTMEGACTGALTWGPKVGVDVVIINVGSGVEDDFEDLCEFFGDFLDFGFFDFDALEDLVLGALVVFVILFPEMRSKIL